MIIGLWLALYWSLFASASEAPGHLPFTLVATENDSASFPDAPHVESACFAQWKGHWVFIGGRVAGYHSMGGTSADFPKAEANRDIWVVDTTVHPARSYHVAVDSLPEKLTAVKDEWISTGQLSYQDGSSFYIAGGYGQDASGHWVTFPLISKINLPLLIDGVMHGKINVESVTFARSTLVQSAGGDLVKLSDNYFYLVMGHVFTGSYTAFEGQGEKNSAPVSQEYLNEIRKLTIEDSARGLAVGLVETFKDKDEFHRRDLNVAKIASPNGIGLAVYGGVFTPDTQLAYSKPVYLFANVPPRVDTSFDQKMNAYRCAYLLLYDRPAATMYTTFFGGISRFAWDTASQKFIENARTSKTSGNYLDGLQWSDQVSTVRKVMAAGKEETTEVVQQCALPAFVGTDAIFIPAESSTRVSDGTDILELAPLRGKKTFVGYLYGGIRAYPFRFPYDKSAQPYNFGTVPTKPSDLILKVYLSVEP